MFLKIIIWLKNNWFKVIVIFLLLKAVGENPYSYYQFLRWVVSLSSGYLTYSFFPQKDMSGFGYLV
ncbi:MAG: hypothetical protein NC922_06865 [Candidatus Omnitrophica bacterium]|nr:hypothetical protein [Candidatus Omnitrophota bacterium]